MADKRRSTTRSSPTLFRKTDETIPELETSEQPDSQTAKQPRIKRTFYLSPEAAVAIDEMQLDEFKKTGKKPEKSEIVDRAIQAFRQQNG